MLENIGKGDWVCMIIAKWIINSLLKESWLYSTPVNFITEIVWKSTLSVNFIFLILDRTNKAYLWATSLQILVYISYEKDKNTEILIIMPNLNSQFGN